MVTTWLRGGYLCIKVHTLVFCLTGTGYYPLTANISCRCVNSLSEHGSLSLYDQRITKVRSRFHGRNAIILLRKGANLELLFNIVIKDYFYELFSEKHMLT